MGFKMRGKSPMMKKLIGKQHNLPEHLKAKIEASPAKHSGAEMYSAKNNPGVDRGHGREDEAGMQNTINTRKKDEKEHDAYHTKYPKDTNHASSSRDKKKKSPAKKYKSDAQRKAVHASKAEKGSPSKMYDKSPVKKKEDKQVPLSAYEKKKGTEITGGSKIERINDLEDRIEFLQSDLNEGKGDIAQLKILKAKLIQLKKS